MIGDEPLVDRKIGYSGEPNLSRAPGLCRRPFDGVVEIDRLRERPGFALSGRFSAAATVDPHRRIALGHPPLRVDGLPVHPWIRLLLKIVGRNPKLVFLIWTQIQNRGEPAGRIGTEYIGLQT